MTLSRTHELIEQWKTNIKSKLFNLGRREKIYRYLSDAKQKKNDVDEKLLTLLLDVQRNQNEFDSVKEMLKAWSTTKKVRSKTDFDKSEAPRKPYSYETDMDRYNEPRTYFHADLADMRIFNVDRRIFRPKYCLVMIDGVSRKIYLRSCQNKKPLTVTKAFESMFDGIERVFDKRVHLQTDKGGEFFNSSFKKWCKENDVVHFSSKTGHAYRAERAIYTLKTLVRRLKMSEQLTVKKSWDVYIEELQDVINSTPCSYSGFTPVQLDANTDEAKVMRIRDRLAAQKKRKAQWKYNNVGRVANEKKKILKPLPVGTLCYRRQLKVLDQDTFSKPSTRTESYWNKNDVYKFIKVMATKSQLDNFYAPTHRYFVEHTINKTKFIVRREDLYPITLNDEDRYFDNYNDYKNNYLNRIAL